MREHMSPAQRAKQFMPFSALKGYEEAVLKSEKLREEKIILGEDAARELDLRLRALKKGDNISVKWFEDGEYLKISGAVGKIDRSSHRLLVADRELEIESISEIEETQPTPK